ncbi:MAG: hypothetical protein PWQ67_837 [Clostridia bacterium]|nr:hypothetical protein [Clostridia bacterium]MDN5322383.1 hypothetical protein [Clostridia bacterium]
MPVKITKSLDLSGQKCPINFLKAKIALEEMAPSEIIELFLDEGEPVKNVPRSLEMEGHLVIDIEKVDKIYRVLVVKEGQNVSI